MRSDIIPIIDYVGLERGDSKSLSDLYRALTDIGFFYLKDVDIPKELCQDMFANSKAFFDQSSQVKSRYRYNTATNVGWLGSNGEKLNTQANEIEVKEAYNFPKFNEQVELPPGFTDSVGEFSRACQGAILTILRATATALGIPEELGGREFFTHKHDYQKPSGDVLRFLCYPPIPKEELNDRVIRAGGHSDFGTFTLLFTTGSHDEGLQILLENKESGKREFVSIPYQKNCIIVNTGDLLEYWTKSLFKSTVHRVIIPSPEHAKYPRYSIAYFCHPNDDISLASIPSLPTKVNKNSSSVESNRADFEDATFMKVLGQPKTAGEHLKMRLARIHQHHT